MIPHIQKPIKPYGERKANKEINRIMAMVKRVRRRRKKKGYGFNAMALIKKEAFKF